MLILLLKTQVVDLTGPQLLEQGYCLGLIGEQVEVRLLVAGDLDRATQQHDAPFHNPPALDPEEIEWTDPPHPLYGRRFQVLSISQPPQRPGHVVVAYRSFLRLRIPVQA